MHARLARAFCATLLCACALSWLACGPPPGAERRGRGVLVVVVDALRADHVSWYGYDRRTTPFLDRLAGEGVAYTQAYSPAPELLPAHAAILTGCEAMLARRIPLDAPSRGAPTSDWYLPPELPRLPREFLSHGYATAAFADHVALSPVCGFDAGFQVFQGYRTEPVADPRSTGPERVVTRFLNWLSGVDSSQSWFAYVHIDELERIWIKSDEARDTLFEPRTSLASVPPVAENERVFFAVPRGRWDGGTRSLGQYETRYDGALQSLDRDLGRLFEGLRRAGRWAETTVAVVGSYGVGLGESGVIADTGTLSDCELHVPVILRPSEESGVAREVRTPQLFSLCDVAPTLLELEHLAVPPSMRGVSQANAVRGNAGAVREIAFAACGLQGGFVALDARACYEESSPGSLEPLAVSPTSVSWYGDDLDHRKDVRRFLHDRADGRVGHLGTGAVDEAASRRLSDAGTDYFAWIEKARALLHGGEDARARAEPRDLDELQRRGLLGE